MTVSSPNPGNSLTPVVLALGATQIIGYGSLYYAFAILAPYISQEFGASLTTLYAIFSIGLLAGGLAAPKLGTAMDHHGAPRLMVGGSALAGLLLAGLAVAPNLWVFGGLLVLLEIVSVTVLYDASFATLAYFGKANARRSITHLTLIAGFASTLFWPLTGWLVETIGWRQTYVVFSGLFLGIALPLHAWITTRHRSTEEIAGAAGQQAQFGPPLEGAAARFAFWAIATSFAMSGVLGSALAVHLVPVLQALDLGASAYLIAMLMGPAQVLIRLTDALFWRSLHPVSVALISAAALPVAIFALLVPVDALVTGAVFAILFGVGQGLSSIVRGTAPLALFGPSGFGARLGQIAAIRTTLSAGAPFLFAVGVNSFGTRTALIGALVFGIVALIPLMMLHRRIATSKSIALMLPDS
ncbi:MAG: MFS transporter [Bosea sp. (in: a-proteobacteria)]